MNRNSKFTIKEIKYLLKKYPLMKSKGIYREVTNTIEKCLCNADEETELLAENVYFKGKSVISMQFEAYLSESQISRKLNTLKKEILIECILNNQTKIFKTAFTRLHNG